MMYKLSDECNRRAYNGVRSAHFAAVEQDKKIPSRVVEQVEKRRWPLMTALRLNKENKKGSGTHVTITSSCFSRAHPRYRVFLPLETYRSIKRD